MRYGKEKRTKDGSINPEKPVASMNRPGWIRILALCMAIVVTATLVTGCTKPQDDGATAELCPNGESHDFTIQTTEAGCTQSGYSTGICQKCGYAYTFDMVNAKGHQWGEPVVIKVLSCTEDGAQEKICNRCGIVQEEPVLHTGHNYVLSSAAGDGSQEQVEYVCSVCGNKIVRTDMDVLYQEPDEKIFVPYCSQDFSFLVRCNEGESYIRGHLQITGDDGIVAYHIIAEDDNTYRIAPDNLYQQYQTYHVTAADDILFSEYNAKELEFSVIGPDYANVELNDDLVFLKELEQKQHITPGMYDLQWDEAAQRYYLTLFAMKEIKPSLVGKVIGIGDYVSAEEVLEDPSRSLCFAKLEKISHDADGNLFLELSVPELSEVYDQLDFYFAEASFKSQIYGDAEQAFMNAVVESEGFAEYLTAVQLAAESFADSHGLVVVPLSESTKDNLKFTLTKKSIEDLGSPEAYRLELGGQISYTIPMSKKDSTFVSSIVLTCDAEIISTIVMSGEYSNDKSTALYLTNLATTTLSFKMAFDLEYSKEYEENFLLNVNTQTIHTATCRIANHEVNRSDLHTMTAQELSEWYHGDKELMQQFECKVCKPVTGLDGTAYAYNINTGVLHCMNCIHVANIKECNLLTLYPDNTFGYTNCNDCRPQDRQARDFDNRMMNAIKGSDWAEQVSKLQTLMQDSVGKQKSSPSTEHHVTATFNIAGVFNISVGIDPVLEFDIQASANFKIIAKTYNQVGIRSVGRSFVPAPVNRVDDVTYDLTCLGEVDAKFGLAFTVMAYPVGCKDFAYISLNAKVGVYGHLSGIFVAEGTVGKEADVFCAARLDAGLFAEAKGYWKILWFDNSFDIMKEKRLSIFKWGYDRMYYAFEKESIELNVDNPDDFIYLDLSTLTNAKYLDLTDMTYHTDAISLTNQSRLTAAVEIYNEDGSICDFLEYNPKTGMILKKDNAPYGFSVTIKVNITPKAQIDSLRSFYASKTAKAVYGYTLDPLEIKLNVKGLTFDEPLVVDTYSEFVVDGNYGYVYCYHIPKIMLPGAEIESINSEIYNTMYQILQKDVKDPRLSSPFVTQMNYSYIQKGSILSLIITCPEYWGGGDYYVYNMNLPKRTAASKDMLLSAFGVNQSEFESTVKAVLSAKFESLYQAAKEYEPTLYKEQLARTVSQENIKAIVPYIDVSGDLCCVARIYSLAGADSYYRLMNLTGSTEPAEPRCTINHAAPSTPEEVTEPTNNSEAGVYTQYLRNGGYEELTHGQFKEKDFEISTVLIDIDSDGTQELLIALMNTANLGVRGYEEHFAVLDIEGNSAKAVVQAVNWGGSDGDDYLRLKYDTTRDQYVIVEDRFSRDGVDATGGDFLVYSSDNWEIEYDVERHYFDMNATWYKDSINKVRSETSLYVIDGNSFWYYKVNGKYVSKDEHDAALERFADPSDPAYQWYSGTFENPINAN